MTPYRVIFLLFPIIVILITVSFKLFGRSYKKINILIVFTTYVLTNIGLYMLIEGAFIIDTFTMAMGLELFLGLNLRQWIDILFVPNTFTFMYLALSLLFIWFMDKIIHKPRIFVKQNNTVH